MVRTSARRFTPNVVTAPVPSWTPDPVSVVATPPKPVPGSDEISRLVRDMTPEQMARQILSLELDGIMRKIQAIELRVTQELDRFTEIINQQMVSDKFSIARKVNRALWIQDKIAKFNFTNLAELQDLMSKAQRYSSALGV